ncbi:MAG: hypothetical protein ABI969_13575 [bacterium]
MKGRDSWYEVPASIDLRDDRSAVAGRNALALALAQLFADDRRPPLSLRSETLVSSRLLEYEVRTRVNARGLARADDETVRGLLGRIAFVEMARPVLDRALEPFAGPVRMLDATSRVDGIPAAWDATWRCVIGRWASCACAPSAFRRSRMVASLVVADLVTQFPTEVLRDSSGH